jgi:hypothetical protein
MPMLEQRSPGTAGNWKEWWWAIEKMAMSLSGPLLFLLV